MSNWFTFADLRDVDGYPYSKIQNASSDTADFTDKVLIPNAMNFVQSYTKTTWSDPPADILRVTKNIAVNMVLADDEDIKIAQARGQPSFTVAGDTVQLDLTAGKNPFISDYDAAVLEDYLNQTKRSIHVDKSRVASQGSLYRSARGRSDPAPTDYVRGDLAGPWYLRP